MRELDQLRQLPPWILLWFLKQITFSSPAARARRVGCWKDLGRWKNRASECMTQLCLSSSTSHEQTKEGPFQYPRISVTEFPASWQDLAKGSHWFLGSSSFACWVSHIHSLIPTGSASGHQVLLLAFCRTFENKVESVSRWTHRMCGLFWNY